jgi:hypothetical protein
LNFAIAELALTASITSNNAATLTPLTGVERSICAVAGDMLLSPMVVVRPPGQSSELAISLTGEASGD